MGKLESSRRHFEGFDLADFAQEFLRRNCHYRQQFERLGDNARRNPGEMPCREMAHSWGLAFPVSA